MSLASFAALAPMLDWNSNTFLNKLMEKMKSWGRILIIIVGVAMVIVGIFKIAQGLISHGKTQVSWVTNILLICVGALFCVGGAMFDMLTNGENGLGNGLMEELNGMGN